MSRAPQPGRLRKDDNPRGRHRRSLALGREIYTTHCHSCHGAAGMGAGPAGENLDPPPASIAHTSHMLGDDYLFSLN